MKKLILAVLCLFLAGCGTFDVRVQIVQRASETVSPAATVPSAAPSAMPAPPATATITITPGSTVTPADEPITLASIQMNDERSGWGVEVSGRIVKTSDGGGTWQNVSPAGGSFGPHSLFAFDNRTGWAVPARLEQNSVVWRTLDGGSTWDASQPVGLGAEKYSPLGLQFPDARHGWLLLLAEGAEQSRQVALYKSDDGGKTWVAVNQLNQGVKESFLDAGVTTMAFFDGQNGWIGGWWGRNDPSQWQFIKTVDGGAKWGTDALRLPAQSGIQCTGQPIPQMAPGSMAMDVTCKMPKDPKYLFHHLYYLSMRVGPVWRSWVLPGDLLSVDFLNASQGWMLTTSDNPRLNQILFTQDGGKSWNELTAVPWRQAQFTFVTDKTGWAIVGTTLMRTENGGKLWIQVYPVLVP